MRVAALAAVLGAIVWFTREYLLPRPEPATTPPPPFRHPSPPPPPAPPLATPRPEPLEKIRGVGPAYKARLADAGITTFAALVSADAEQLAARLDLRVATVVDWKTQATEYLE